MTYDVPAGEMCFHAITNAVQLAKTNNTRVDLEFNEIPLRIYPDSNRDDICTIYDLRSLVRRLKAGHKD